MINQVDQASGAGCREVRGERKYKNAGTWSFVNVRPSALKGRIVGENALSCLLQVR